MGDVWEWTSSDFVPWPGFEPMLYADYSEPFFGGDYKVLRGGSWAVGGAVGPPVFRNWDLRSAARSSADCAWPGTRLDVQAPRLARRAAHASPSWSSSRVRALRQSYEPRRQRARADERRRLGRRLLRPRTAPSRCAGARPGRCGATPRSPRWRRLIAAGCVLAAVRSATVGHADRRERRGAVHRRPLAALAQRPASTGPCCRPTPRPSRSCDSARPRRARLRPGPGPARRDRHRGGRRSTRRPGSACCSPTAPASWRRHLGRPAELPRRARRGRRGQRALRRRPALGRRTRPTPAGGDPRPGSP